MSIFFTTILAFVAAVWLALANNAAAEPTCQFYDTSEITEELHTFRKYDTLSEVLYRISKEKGLFFCLYGKSGWWNCPDFVESFLLRYRRFFRQAFVINRAVIANRRMPSNAVVKIDPYANFLA